MRDTIDRQTVIDKIKSHYRMHDNDLLELIVYEIENLPSAQPERKKGKWIDETFKPWGLVHHPYKCDQCGNHSEVNSNFCPNCGCDMRGEQDD